MQALGITPKADVYLLGSFQNIFTGFNMRLSSDGQVTIPLDIRLLANLQPGCEVEFKFDNGRVWLVSESLQESAERNRVLALVRQAKGCATANIDIRVDDIMQLTRGD